MAHLNKSVHEVYDICWREVETDLSEPQYPKAVRKPQCRQTVLRDNELSARMLADVLRSLRTGVLGLAFSDKHGAFVTNARDYLPAKEENIPVRILREHDLAAEILGYADSHVKRCDKCGEDVECHRSGI